MKKQKNNESVKTEQLTIALASSVYVFPDLPLVFPSLPYHSSIVDQLNKLGVVNIAIDIAKSQQLAGRLNLFGKNWDKICNDRWVLDAIQGYQIEWLASPCQGHHPASPHFSKEETESLETEVGKMISKGAITPVESGTENGFVSSIFLVPKKDGGHRPIINLKRLNYFVPHHHFKMEGIHMLKDLLKQGDFMAKIDLKDAYFAVPISEPDKKYLRFRWKSQMYQFNCLPFGLSCAPWVFTKITKAVAAVLREMGVRIIMYIDDMLIMAESETLLRDHVKGVVYLLENLGFVINFPKSSLEPKRALEFLGFQVDSMSMELKLPGDKIKNIRGEARKILAADHVTALTLSRVLGKMNAATKAICMAPLFYRQLQAELQQALSKSCQDYNTPIHLSPMAREELEWWNTHFTNWNGRSLIAKKPNVSLETDASLTGWGAVCRGVRTGGPWSREEQNLHINCLEMLAAFLAFKCFFREERSIHILLKMDNTSAIAYINKKGGTVSPTLNKLNKEFWLWCMERDITVQAQHLAGALNCTADAESRVMRDRSDWMLNPSVFQAINHRLGPLEVDLFASRLTAQLRSFVSWRPDPEAIATDAFTMTWTGLKAYANPPWSLVGRVLSQVHQQKADLILVAPVWKAQTWYPTVLEMCRDFPLLIPQGRNLIQPTLPQSMPEVVPQLAVWSISGDDTKTSNFRRKLQSSCSRHGGRNPPKHMTLNSRNGLAGAIKGVQIPFHALSGRW